MSRSCSKSSSRFSRARMLNYRSSMINFWIFNSPIKIIGI